MKKYFIMTLILLAAGSSLAFFNLRKKQTTNIDTVKKIFEVKNDVPGPNPILTQVETNLKTESEVPLNNPTERITKKPFGIHIIPATSPVQPERFSGYHTGTDFEILPGEENIDVEVRAICDGKIIYKNSVNGYGGVIIQSCSLNNENVTLLYGHISLTKSPVLSGTSYERDDVIAILGKGYSSETDGERKHLHLGIHKGSSIEFMGYVGNQNQLSGWIDFQSL